MGTSHLQPTVEDFEDEGDEEIGNGNEVEKEVDETRNQPDVLFHDDDDDEDNGEDTGGGRSTHESMFIRVLC